ncbi:uncharacterized protein [Venturia canescens]|uniref:uncharacterized protein n=1 Tax=Venturia canescens TaxID=32260 RepID=UPI001C9CA9A5|nr:uncharacterized protein LOC122408576 [Venturia canescens]
MTNSSRNEKLKTSVFYGNERLLCYDPPVPAGFRKGKVELDSLEGIDFYPNACHVCRAYGEKVKLKRCGNCKAIAYCSKEHQTQHWPEHKNICRVFTKVSKCCDEKFKMDALCSKDLNTAWVEARTNLMKITASELNNRLSPIELDMIWFPRSCEICHETDPSKLNDCTECPNSSFCIKHPRESSHHFATCGTLKFCFDMNAVSMKPIDVPLVPNYGKSMPVNMNQAIDVYLKHHDLDNIYESLNIWAALLSERLTKPYTFLFAMQKVSLPKKRYIQIHVIGANKKEMDNVHLWENLLHHNEFLKELKIVFVGPELQTGPIKIKLCDQCKKNKRKMILQRVGDLYPNFAGGDFFTRPDYVIGFQLGIGFSGLSGFSLAWDQTLDILSVIRCPFIITSYCAMESQMDQTYINAQFEARMEFCWTGRNPFSSLLPRRDLDCNDFYYVNQYLTVYKTLLPLEK